MTQWLRPEDGSGVTYEFYAPFAHVPGKFEWCRIRAPGYGAFDTFILIGASTREPATVYVNDAIGERFMRERYPECATFPVPREDLEIRELDAGLTVKGDLRATVGPLRLASMTLTAPRGARVRNVPYGGEGVPVWGSRRFTCWGVDLLAQARASGQVVYADGRTEELAGVEAVVTLGSFGRIAPLP